MAIVVENNREELQYQIFKAGELAGFVQYSMSGYEIWLRYTSMKRSFKSAVLGDILMHHVLMDAHTSRLAVLPFCPAIRTFIAEHVEFASLVPTEWQARIPAPSGSESGAEPKSPLDFVRMTGSRRSRLHETTLNSADVTDYVAATMHPDPHPTGMDATPTGG